MTEAIHINNVVKTYPGGQRALDGFALAVQGGEVFGFLGPNGAGKTTTIKILLGLLEPDSGTVSVLGGDPRLPVTRRRIGYMPEVACYYGFLTARELLRFYGRVCGLSAAIIRRRSDALLQLVGLDAAADRPLRNYSKGMMQRAGIAQALLHDPDLLILDEPLTGLDPLARIQLRDVIVQLRQQGKTVFFSSHELSEAELICDRVGILRQGRLCWAGPLRDVAGDGQVNLERVFLKFLRDDATGVPHA